jgi:pteridine reductase
LFETTIIITGAARRVGAEIACTLHGAGARVMLHCRDSTEEAATLAARLNALRPGSAATMTAELGDPSALNALVAETVAHFGRLDGLVNNASTFFATPLGGIDEASWRNLLDSNLKGAMFLSQAAAPHLRTTKGAIVNITDIHAERPMKGYSIYCVAKAGLLGLTRSMAVELAPEVRVNAVAPGAILWPDRGNDFPPDERAAIIADTLLKRLGSPTDIARTTKFLIFEAPYITGQVINVDGGRTAHL